MRALSPGGRRFASQGKVHKDGDDGDNGWLTVEHKEREKLPAWLVTAFDQARVNGVTEPGRCNIVGLSYHRGQGYPVRQFVMMEMETWLKWFGSNAK